MKDARAVRLTIELSPLALRRAGEHAVALIVERTQEGQDAEGQAFRPYSTRDLALPVGAIPKRVLSRLKSQQDGLAYFTSRRGTLWTIIEGGYAAYKKAHYPQDSGLVNLTATGAMLRSLRVLSVRTNRRSGVVILGFSRESEAWKALWNSSKRTFLGLPAPEREEVSRIAGEGATVRVR